MKRLTALRHAKAESHAATGSDFDRPLAAQGRRQIADLCEALRGSPAPNRAFVSPAKRTRETFQALCEALDWEPATTFDRRLYLAEVGEIVELLRDAGEADDVLVVGHNPGMEELVGSLAGAGTDLAPCEFASFALPIATWDDLSLDVRGEVLQRIDS